MKRAMFLPLAYPSFPLEYAHIRGMGDISRQFVESFS